MHKARKEEIENQEKTGMINKSKNIGRFKYKQRKLEYQLQEELAGNLRTMKPLGNDLLIEDRFDSLFRRNLVEPDAPTQGEKRRQRKAKYKNHNPQGQHAREMHAEVEAHKKRNDQRERGIKSFKNDDVIML